MITQLRYRFSNPGCPTRWAGLVPTRDGSAYLAVGMTLEPYVSHARDLVTVTGHTPAEALQALVQQSGRSWAAAIAEPDVLTVSPAEWRDLIQAVTSLTVISDHIYQKATPLWADNDKSRDRAIALWLALTAGQNEQLEAGRHY